MTYRYMARILRVPLCDGACGIEERLHDKGVYFLGVLHWHERRFTRRGAKRFLSLVARERRESSSEWLNDPKFEWMYVYNDAVMAQAYARQLGFRIPGRLFDNDRWQCKWLAHKDGVKLSNYPAIYQWANDV